MSLINYIKTVFHLPQVHEFLVKAISIEKNPSEKYKSWLGFNYKENELDSIKIYFTFYRELTVEEIASIFTDKQTKIYFENYDKKNIESIISTYEYGSGFAIGLKVDMNLEVTTAFGYNLFLEDSDLAFLNINNFKKNDFLNQKGIYHHFSGENQYVKKYFYLKNPIEIQKKMNEVDFPVPVNVPVLEIGLGKGFYNGSEDKDEKYILLGNYVEVFDTFLKSSIVFEKLKTDFHLLDKEIGVEGFCPGIYQNKKVQSFYIGFKSNQILNLDTVEKIIEKLK